MSSTNQSSFMANFCLDPTNFSPSGSMNYYRFTGTNSPIIIDRPINTGKSTIIPGFFDYFSSDINGIFISKLHLYNEDK
jgi:hypothetical protein